MIGAAFRGFAIGTLALIALYVAVQEGTSGKTEAASNALVAGMRRLFSPEVAGIGNHAKTTATGAAPDRYKWESNTPSDTSGPLFT